jgi:5-hydroxyisourate hydrolase
MGQLTTHVLDISAGVAAAGVRIDLYERTSTPNLLTSIATGRDGRCAAPLLEGANFRAGRYSLTFYVAEYFRRCGVNLPLPPFLEDVVIQFGVAQPEQHYHVPLLISPWSYSVYRGG